SEADVKLAFVKRDHGDGFPFDGKGGKYAHAFFPEADAAYQGRIHFDLDDAWNSTSFPGSALFHMLLHETGHALGLNHSRVRDSVMYPYIRRQHNAEVLLEEDVVRIRRMYSSECDAMTTTTTTTTTTAAPSFGDWRSTTPAQLVYRPAQPIRARAAPVFYLCYERRCDIFGRCGWVRYSCSLSRMPRNIIYGR
ncbi:PREDICTED: hatching enzyme-like, partial [Priapulus caudatus]|uniref:Hatching enzyme-like n=1 Tax=Priapulus caudatus TaxID=37621 RepID=A0ABM1F1Z1_PRICU